MRGGLAVCKVCGITSFDVIRRLRKVLPPETKLGHAGTLDPAARGLLLILAGKATRVQHLLADLDKEYAAEIRLGIRTDTLDMQGKVLEEAPVPAYTKDDLSKVLRTLEGKRMQRPPKFSALKIGGERAYRLARRGKDFRIPLRQVQIHEIELTSWECPLLAVRTTVSSGTYIRSLAAEIGEKLGLPAALSSLIRTRIGSFKIEDSLTLDNLDIDRIKEAMIPIPGLLAHLPRLEVSLESAKMLLEGKGLDQKIPPVLLQTPVSIVFSTDHRMGFICETRQGKLYPRRMIYDDKEETNAS